MDKLRIGMRTGLWLAVAGVLLTGGSGCISVSGSLERETTVVEHRAEAGNPYLGKIRHVVLYAYKPETSPELIADFEAQGRAMIDQIPQIKAVERGTLLGNGSRAQGYTHGLIFTYDSEEELQAYIAHPAHQAFVQTTFPHLSQMLVFDYVAEE